MSEKPIVIDTDEIEKFLYVHLAKRGFAPGQKEVEELADIFFDFLIEKQIMREED